MNEIKTRLVRTGYMAFFLSGICAISSGVIVSILQEKYGFSFSMTGTMLSVFSIGNMIASFLSGILPSKIGSRRTVLLLCSGYFIGYLLMAFFGAVGILLAAFLMVGLAKGCAINNCTTLVGQNSEDRTRGMSIMHACYATGAMLCPFLIGALLNVNQTIPMVGVALMGLVMWLVFFFGLREKRTANQVPSDKDATAASDSSNAVTSTDTKKADFSFLRSGKFWLLTALIFCQNAAETSVTGWLVTYYKNQNILSGTLSTYTVTVLWGATLIARLLIAFVFPIKNVFKALSIMGIGCTVMYAVLMFQTSPVPAIIALFLFAFAMAGVNPVGVAGVGEILNETSMGVLLPIGGIGAILMPWIIGIVAERVSLSVGMMTNLIPCIGIFVISVILWRNEKKH